MRALDAEQEYRSKANLIYLQLYGGADYRGLSGNLYAQVTSNTSRLRLNIVRSMTTTATSKIAKMKPRVIALTEGGNWSEQQRAKRLSKFIAGAFYKLDLYAKGQRGFLDSCVFDEGLLKFYVQDGEICCERVFPGEMRVDDAEAVNGEPRSIHQTKLISRETLLARYGADEVKATAIRESPRGDEEWSGLQWQPDMIRVTESWHLRSGPKEKDGRHSIVIKGGTLLDEEYKRDRFPFEVIRWDEMPLGWHGNGLAGQLMPLQYEINKLLVTIQRSMHLSTPYMLIESGSTVNPAQLTNELWNLIFYVGQQPTPVTPPIVHPQVLEQLQNLIRQAYEITGISQLSAQSKKPEGLDSGKALREYNDIESERFQMVSQRYEGLYLRCADQILDLARELGGYSVRHIGKGEVQRIDWKDVDMDRDAFVMQLVPTSFLPSTPAGKLATVQEMMQAGLIEREDGLSLLDFPDLEALANRQNAALRNIEMRIERMLDDTDPQYHPPEPYTNLGLAVKRVTAAYEEAQLQGAPEENLELLRRYLADCQHLIESTQPQAQPPPDQASMVPQLPALPQAGAPPSAQLAAPQGAPAPQAMQ